jgi:hypothetical protein
MLWIALVEILGADGKGLNSAALVLDAGECSRAHPPRQREVICGSSDEEVDRLGLNSRYWPPVLYLIL